MRLLRTLRSPLRTLRFIGDHPLGSELGWTAYRDWFRWQVGSRLVPGPVVVPFVEDTSLVVEPGMTGATGNVYCGLHEASEMGFLLHFLRDGETFVDVGANVGTFTVLAAGVVGAHATAFEPIPVTFAKLMRNVAYNQLGDLVDARCTAVGAKNGRVVMSAGLDTTNHILDPEESATWSATTEVAICSLDEALAGAASTFVKIDVEGRENAVVEGGRTTLRDARTQVLIVEVLGSHRQGAIVRNLAEMGYVPVEYNILTREIFPREGLSEGGNTIFVKDVLHARERVSTAPRFRIKSLLV